MNSDGPPVTRSAIRCVLTLFTLAGLAAFETCPVDAGRFNRVLTVGDKAPAWSNLEGTDGKRHSLSDLAEAPAVLVVFTCNHCPAAKAWEDRLLKLAGEARKRGVRTVAISVSRLEADQLPEMKKRAREKKYPFAYLHDPSQKTGRDYGALNTPQVFLLDHDRRVVYMGAIDDSLHEDKVTARYLQDAIEALLSGVSPEVTETRPVGCPIEYESP